MEMTHYNKIRYLKGEKAPAGNLINEEVLFTEDFETPAKDFFATDMEVVADEILDDMKLPNCFPIETTLKNTST